MSEPSHQVPLTTNRALPRTNPPHRLLRAHARGRHMPLQQEPRRKNPARGSRLGSGVEMKGNGLGEKSETGQCVGGALITHGCSGPNKRGWDGTNAWAGASVEDSRLNPRLDSRTSTGGDDTTLTPFSFLPSCDSAIDSLPELFLAYCTLQVSEYEACYDSNPDTRPVPESAFGHDSDLVPFLTH
jgi:hypothetical protein